MAETKVASEQIITYPKCRVVRTTTTSIPTNTWTAIPFDVESFDTDSMHDNATNNTRITIPKAGYYLVLGQAYMTANATGGRGVKFNYNGVSPSTNSNDGGGTFETADSTYPFRRNISAIRYFNAGDYVDMRVYQTSGGALNIEPGASEYELGTWFSAIMIP